MTPLGKTNFSFGNSHLLEITSGFGMGTCIHFHPPLWDPIEPTAVQALWDLSLKRQLCLLPVSLPLVLTFFWISFAYTSEGWQLIHSSRSQEPIVKVM